MSWLDRIINRFRWSYVGTVKGECVLVDKDGNLTPGGNKTTYWNLYERGDGKRQFDVIGDPVLHSSQAVRHSEAQVLAWLYGGPKPDIDQSFDQKSPKPKAKLISFPGGRDGAA